MSLHGGVALTSVNNSLTRKCKLNKHSHQTVSVTENITRTWHGTESGVAAVISLTDFYAFVLFYGRMYYSGQEELFHSVGSA